MPALRLTAAQPDDLTRYLDFLEAVADWLAARGINQWRPGTVRASAAYYAESITRGEVHWAFVGDEAVGTLRLLLREPIAWPDVLEDDAVYVFNLAVKRTWAGRGLGGQMLDWVNDQAARLGRRYVRLDCMTENAFLRRYYTQAGFHDRGDIEAHFPGPWARCGCDATRSRYRQAERLSSCQPRLVPGRDQRSCATMSVRRAAPRGREAKPAASLSAAQRRPHVGRRPSTGAGLSGGEAMTDMLEDSRRRARIQACFASGYFALYVSYLFVRPEGELLRWVSLVLLPLRCFRC